MAWDHYESTQDELLQLPKQTAYSWEMGSAYFEMLLLIANFCNSKILMSFSNFALNIFFFETWHESLIQFSPGNSTTVIGQLKVTWV